MTSDHSEGELHVGSGYKPVYDAADVTAKPSLPGTFPYSRGTRKDGYRSKLWTMRQYAGFGTATETNRRYRELLDSGQTGLSMAFDLPTQMGYDSDDPVAHGEVGKVGVAIDSYEDMEIALHELPLDRITTSMTINATASLLLLLYELCAVRRNMPLTSIGGTIQNDILKEYASRGTYIFPPEASMRLVVDSFEYCSSVLPRWNPISVSGYHMREAGATAAQEVAFTIANAIEYVEAAMAKGLSLEIIVPRITFFFNVSNDFIEEIAKFRAARQVWANVVREKFKITDPRAQMLRCHAQTSGVSLTAQQPLNNIVRIALQSAAAVLGGVQSLHANGFDEALALPTSQAAEIALRTQQIIAYESGIASIADPFGGSYALEAITNDLVDQVHALLAEVEDAGGAVLAIEAGLYQQHIADAAYQFQQQVDEKEQLVVGVNSFQESNQLPVEILHITNEVEEAQCERLAILRKRRNQPSVDRALHALERVARSTGNLMIPIRKALEVDATCGEVCTVLKDVFGSYEPPAIV